MSTVGAVQRKIDRVEGFQVRFRHLDGGDVRDDMRGLPQYPYSNMARNGSTVKNWKELRFNKAFPGFRVDVLYKDGKVCDGRCLLANVRDTYLD